MDDEIMVMPPLWERPVPLEITGQDQDDIRLVLRALESVSEALYPRDDRYGDGEDDGPSDADVVEWAICPPRYIDGTDRFLAYQRLRARYPEEETD